MRSGICRASTVRLRAGFAFDRRTLPNFFAFASLVALLALASAPRVLAQGDTESSPPVGRFHFGPLWFTPSIVISNIGIDNNVFNDPVNPQSDETAAIGPSTTLAMSLGHSRLTGTVGAQYLYYNKFDNQRGWNTTDSGRWELPLNRLTPFVMGSYSNLFDRPGFEIQERVRSTADSVGAGTTVRLSPLTSLILTGKRSESLFAPDQTYLGTDLATVLNYSTTTAEVQFRYMLTSLTTFVVDAQDQQNRFSSDTLRNANSVVVLPGFEMKPSALISGTVSVGYRDFEPRDAVVPTHRGLVAAANATYTAGPTMVTAKVSRDVAYSFEETQPYYTLTDIDLTVTEHITYVWDVVLRGGHQTLDYEQVAALLLPSPPEVDGIWQYGGGIGYRVGRTLRLGFDGTYYQSHASNSEIPDYHGLRMGASISYGLPQ